VATISFKTASFETSAHGLPSLRTVAVVAGLAWSVLFVTVGVATQLQLYGDGAIFSYAIVVEDAWAFHWHNIPGRAFVYVFASAPAEAYIHLTRDANGGLDLYGFLFFAAPLLGLIATFAADRSKDRIITSFACSSTASLCPLVFGFPTEVWMAHALFWPTLAVCQYARRGIAGMALVFVALLALVFSYDGALVFAVAIVATLLLRGMWNAAFIRAGLCLLVVTAIWTSVRAAVPPDSYDAPVLASAAAHVFDLSIFTSDLALLLFGALASYGILLCIFQYLQTANGFAYATALVALGLAAYWIWFDHGLHAENRYYMRTLVLIAVPVLGGLAAAYAHRCDGDLRIPFASRLLSMFASEEAARAAIGALLLVILVHAVETAKFVAVWQNYKTAVRSLAMGTASDPALGDSRFVSSARIPADLNRVSWFSTTPFLSVLLAPGFAPMRLVMDPRVDNYFWLTCAIATENATADRAIPVESRRLLRVHACLHR
jgi:hypothetical protein